MTIKALVLTPYGNGTYESRHYACMRELENTTDVDVVKIDGCSQLDVARDTLAMQGLTETDAEIFLWIDHDTIFTTDDALGIIYNCREGEYDILGGLYSKRSPGMGFAGTPDVKDTVIDFFVDGSIPGKILGMGFTAVRRKVFTTLAQMHPASWCSAAEAMLHPFFMPFVTEDKRRLSEDQAFLNRAVSAGFKVGIDTKPNLGHRGLYDYHLEDAVMKLPRAAKLSVTFQ